jgi:hypothetical protein
MVTKLTPREAGQARPRRDLRYDETHGRKRRLLLASVKLHSCPPRQLIVEAVFQIQQIRDLLECVRPAALDDAR